MDAEALKRAGLAPTDGGVSAQLNQVLSQSVPQSGDGPPEFIQLTPGGNRFVGRDGRNFRIRSPRQMVRDFNNSGEDLQLDLDHESEMPFGSSASVGWLVAMELRNNREIWGQVEWTPAGESLVQDRTFRGISPTFLVDPDSVREFLENPNKPMDVIGFQSVALTNRPNLPLRSLNTTQGTPEEKQTMDMEKLFAALGLEANASEADVLKAVGELKTPAEPNAALPNLDQFVPRSDYEQVQTQLNTANSQLQAQAEAQHNAAVDAAVKGALTSGKIAPASEAYHRECCSTAEGLAKFQDYVAKAPAIVAPNVQEAPKETAPQEKNNAAISEIAAKWGFTAEQYLAEKALLIEEGKLQG